MNSPIAALVPALLVTTMSFAAADASVYSDPSAFNGTRSVGDGLAATTSSWNNASITWGVTAEADGGYFTYTYTYTFTGFSSPAISHIVLDLSLDAFNGKTLVDPDVVSNVSVNGESVVVAFTGKSFPHEPGIEGGVKFESLPDASLLTLIFESNRAPVWGHIAIKGGQKQLTNLAYQSTDPMVLSEVTSYIARPNGTVVAVPEPGAAVLAGMLLFPLLTRAGSSRRRATVKD